MTDRELLFWIVVLQLVTATVLVVAIDLIARRAEERIYVYRPGYRSGSDETFNDTSKTTRAAGVGAGSDAEEAGPAPRRDRNRPVTEE